MGELTLWEKIRKFFEEEFNWSAAMERFLNQSTLHAVLVGLVGLGVFRWTEIEVNSFEMIASAAWMVWMAGRNPKKTIRKVVEATPVE